MRNEEITDKNVSNSSNGSQLTCRSKNNKARSDIEIKKDERYQSNKKMERSGSGDRTIKRDQLESRTTCLRKRAVFALVQIYCPSLSLSIKIRAVLQFSHG